VKTEINDFWKQRSQKYGNLEWAVKGDYLHEFLNSGQFCEADTVLDVGTGTGIIAHAIAPFVKQVVGFDISEDMLARAKHDTHKNIQLFRMDAHDLKFDDESFTKITARMVFHHITEHTQKAMSECFRVLKKNGLMVFSEGVPPTEHVKEFYTEMFKLKEDRITFMEDDLVSLMQQGGFKKIDKKVFWIRQTSIRNWLENSGLPQETQDKIFEMHIALDDQGKRDYSMQIRDNDCFIDMKFIILIGQKI